MEGPIYCTTAVYDGSARPTFTGVGFFYIYINEFDLRAWSNHLEIVTTSRS